MNAPAQDTAPARNAPVPSLENFPVGLFAVGMGVTGLGSRLAKGRARPAVGRCLGECGGWHSDPCGDRFRSGRPCVRGEVEKVFPERSSRNSTIP